jgi:hypothetical protein
VRPRKLSRNLLFAPFAKKKYIGKQYTHLVLGNVDQREKVVIRVLTEIAETDIWQFSNYFVSKYEAYSKIV